MELFLLILLAVPLVTAELPLAEPCVPEECVLPDCRCSSTEIPGGLDSRDTPQLVMLTFDAAINSQNTAKYAEWLYHRRNWNGCPVSATFFVPHEYTNYINVNDLYNNGFELALNSISQRTPQQWWAEADEADLMQEIADQRKQIAHFANIPTDEIKGFRTPFFQMTGNTSYQVLKEIGMVYDSTWSSSAMTNPGIWPYTLDYLSVQDCNTLPCPTASIPGVWVNPQLSWIDLSGFPCTVISGCFHGPAWADEESWFRFMVDNFERHYLGNRAPFSINLSESFISTFPTVERSLVRFLDMLNSIQDVYMVRQSEVIEWVKKPIPINEYNDRPCYEVQSRLCAYNMCELYAEHNDLTYYMSICTPSSCPRVYPWVGNPLGL